MIGHHVSTGNKSDYSTAYSGNSTVQIIENAPGLINWLIVRNGAQEQKIALDFTTLQLLMKAVSIHPRFEEAKGRE